MGVGVGVSVDVVRMIVFSEGGEEGLLRIRAAPEAIISNVRLTLKSDPSLRRWDLGLSIKRNFIFDVVFSQTQRS